jgi:hypothetical protein
VYVVVDPLKGTTTERRRRRRRRQWGVLVFGLSLIWTRKRIIILTPICNRFFLFFLFFCHIASLHRGKSGTSHNTGFKTRQRVNRLGSSTGVEGKKMEQRVRRLLGAYN